MINKNIVYGPFLVHCSVQRKIVDKDNTGYYVYCRRPLDYEGDIKTTWSPGGVRGLLIMPYGRVPSLSGYKEAHGINGNDNTSVDHAKALRRT